MTHDEFMQAMLAPGYTWRMALAMLDKPKRFYNGQPNGAVYSAPGRMVNAQQKIDELVLQRASAIRLERIRRGNADLARSAE